jgi:hypothetical protein
MLVLYSLSLALSLCPLCGDTVALAARLLGDADWSDKPSTVELDMDVHRLEYHFQIMLARNARIYEQRASSHAHWTICRHTHSQHMLKSTLYGDLM